MELRPIFPGSYCGWNNNNKLHTQSIMIMLVSSLVLTWDNFKIAVLLSVYCVLMIEPILIGINGIWPHLYMQCGKHQLVATHSFSGKLGLYLPMQCGNPSGLPQNLRCPWAGKIEYVLILIEGHPQTHDMSLFLFWNSGCLLKICNAWWVYYGYNAHEVIRMVRLYSDLSTYGYGLSVQT